MEVTPDAVTADLPDSDVSLAEPTAGVYEPVDLDGDGVVDGIFVQLSAATAFVALDTDANSSLDTAFIDLDGDGSPDVTVTSSDGGYLFTDASGTGEATWMSRADVIAAVPDLAAVLDMHLPAGPAIQDVPAPLDGSEGGGTDWRVDDGVLIGDPTGDSQFWFEQAANGFCLPASIAQIVSEYTGVIFTDEMPFVEIANEIGAFSVGHDGVPGISFEKGVEILNAAGVPAEYRFGDLETLAADLDAGRNIIVFIDSGELWTGEAAEDSIPDHAVVVTGIDTARGTVLLSDPGSPGGNLAEVPIGLFMNSWADSQNAMIVCDQAPADAGATPAGGQATPVLEATTSQAIQQPWVLLPVSLPSTTLTSL